MRPAVAFVIAAALLVLPAAAAQDPAAPALVSVSITTASVREGRDTRADVLLLWNRNVRTRPIGHALKTCVKAGSGGLLGGGVMNCTLSISLPLGKVAAAGIVHQLRRYTLVVTGGTGKYEGAHGPLFVRSVSGDGVRRMTFSAP